MYAHMSAPVPSPRELRGEVPEELDALVRRSMAKDPAERPATAGVMVEALLAFGAAGSGHHREEPAGPHPPASEPTSAVDEPTPTRTAATNPIPPSPDHPPPKRGSRKVPRGVALGALAAAAVIVIAGVVLLGGGSGEGDGSQTIGNAGGPAQPGKEPLAPVALEPVAVGSGADGVAVGEGFVWVADKDDDLVTRINPSTRRKAGTTPVGREPDSIAIGEGGVWVTNSSSHSVSRIDPKTSKVVEEVPVGREPEGIAVGKGAVWVANGGAGTVTRIDADGRARRTTAVGPEPVQLALAPSSVWVTVSGDGTIVQLDPETGEIGAS